MNGVTWDFIKNNIDQSFPLLVSLDQAPSIAEKIIRFCVLDIKSVATEIT